MLHGWVPSILVGQVSKSMPFCSVQSRRPASVLAAHQRDFHRAAAWQHGNMHVLHVFATCPSTSAADTAADTTWSALVVGLDRQPL